MVEGGNLIYKELSYKIIGILYGVHNSIGYGYQEKHYERAIIKSLIDEKINFKNQVPYKLAFKNEIIGRFFLDFVVDEKIVVEIKKGNYFSKNNIEQVKEYLKITNLKLAILANFTSTGVKALRVLNPNNLKH